MIVAKRRGDVAGWEPMRSGYHRCTGCGAFVQATVERPVWMHWVGTVASNCTCTDCADKVAA